MKKGKTECVLFRTHQTLVKAEKVCISLNGKEISESDSYEDLGVIMDN